MRVLDVSPVTRGCLCIAEDARALLDGLLLLLLLLL